MSDEFEKDGERDDFDWLIDEAVENRVDFKVYPNNKRKLTDFTENTYLEEEEEAVDRAIERKIYEHESETEGSTPYHKPGHLGPLMWQYLNMVGVEAAFSDGLQHTKSSMTKTIQQRADEINSLLRGVGGFNRQVKASFTRSAVNFLEQDDPDNRYRERIVFTLNLAEFELRYPLEGDEADQVTDDGRTVKRLVWDEAINTLSEIVSNTGLKPKYVKNDKKRHSFKMAQHLISGIDTPDEFFVFDLNYMSQEQRERREEIFVSKMDVFDEKIEKYEKKLKKLLTSPLKAKLIRSWLDRVKAEKEYFMVTNPDPREMDTGIILAISANTLKDYNLTKDKMQVIMTKFILALSAIATDKSMDQQVNTVYQQKQAQATSVQDLGKKMRPASRGKRRANKKAS